jgi:16S rRNA (uracil1498-N3)-methyltransferase
VRLTRLYLNAGLSCGDRAQLDKCASNHLVRVLRTRIDSPLILFNGDGYDYLAVTLDENAKHTSVLIQSRQKIENESSLSITLIQGLSRQDRMETTVQKSVELGVSRIIPVLCQRSNTRLNTEKAQKKLSHWNSVAISASEQSGRCIVPEVAELCTIQNIGPQISGISTRILLDPEADSSLKEISPKDNNVAIFIGPEGGLNDEETRLLKDNDFTAVTFGPRILRTETAGPAVISAAQTLWGDF